MQLASFRRELLQDLRREAALCASMKVQDLGQEVRRLQDELQRQADLVDRQLEAAVRQAVEACMTREARRQQPQTRTFEAEDGKAAWHNQLLSKHMPVGNDDARA